MTNSKPIYYEALCDELLKHYLEPEYYLTTKSPITYVTTKVTATALDEYIKLSCYTNQGQIPLLAYRDQ